MNRAGNLVLCLTTVANDDDALEMSRVLVEERLAACVSRTSAGVRSVYRWEGAIRDDAEVHLLIKAPAVGIERLRARVVALSKYDVPEFVVLEVASASEAYLSWALAACEPEEEGGT